jgi:hypothetical protein
VTNDVTRATGSHSLRSRRPRADFKPKTGSEEKIMTSSDDSRPKQSAQPAGVPREEQRSMLGQLAEHAADGSVQAAAGYVTVKALGKVFGGRDSGEGGGKPEPPVDQPPPETE